MAILYAAEAAQSNKKALHQCGALGGYQAGCALGGFMLNLHQALKVFYALVCIVNIAGENKLIDIVFCQKAFQAGLDGAV